MTGGMQGSGVKAVPRQSRGARVHQHQAVRKGSSKHLGPYSLCIYSLFVGVSEVRVKSCFLTHLSHTCKH